MRIFVSAMAIVSVLFDFVVCLSVFIWVSTSLLGGRCYALILSLHFLLAASCVLGADVSVDVWQSDYLGALLPSISLFRWCVTNRNRPHIVLRPLLLNWSNRRICICKVAWVFRVLKNRMDIISLCLGRQILFHFHCRHIAWGKILAQVILCTMIVALFDGCSMILLYFSLDSTDLLLNEIYLLVNEFASRAIATLLFSWVIIILMHSLVILVLCLWGWISYVARCLICVI